jgi:hypothetical protein
MYSAWSNRLMNLTMSNYTQYFPHILPANHLHDRCLKVSCLLVKKLHVFIKLNFYERCNCTTFWGKWIHPTAPASLRFIVIIFFHLCLDLPSSLFLQIPCFLNSPLFGTYTDFILNHLLKLIILFEHLKLWSLLLCFTLCFCYFLSQVSNYSP